MVTIIEIVQKKIKGRVVHMCWAFLDKRDPVRETVISCWPKSSKCNLLNASKIKIV